MNRLTRTLGVIALAAACGTSTPDKGTTVTLDSGPVYTAFENASIVAGVPRDLLLAIAWK